ncbi:isoprenylcysteine carboxylmethyltransferase family protein [uncultured Aquimarina sp.]|uniref:methyltransferase family protein n=1 Tax=uncultured Aquimarina sp. TaxID=575652 RepID=UPI002615901F|nr:isoprenylcysteine carboxylmethyltransferase family protein [uncultured Aquimarina sp.]
MELKTKDFVFVFIQFGLFLVYVFEMLILKVNWPSLINKMGLLVLILGILIVLISLIQLNKNLSPFPSPKVNSELIQTGLYKFIRHPIYAGILCVVFGYGFYTDSVFKLIVATAIYVFFHFKSRYEEKKLLVFFEEYKTYKESTGRFLPRFFSFLTF